MESSTKSSPVASKGSMVCVGPARITILTANLIRFEWAKEGIFEDRKTLAVSNRKLPIPPYTVSTKGQTTTVGTGPLTITYNNDGNPFHTNNLSAVFDDGIMKFRWSFGSDDKKNLGGTIATLDGIRGRNHYKSTENDDGVQFTDPEPVDLGHGLVSRSGWAVVDDSGTVVLDCLKDGREWAHPRADANDCGATDIYLLAYGHDYKSAVKEASLVFGSQPLPPRYALGYWYSRYWAYTDREIEDLVSQYDQMGLPLDIMVIDMDWHLQGWTGYTWDKCYFPDPQAHLSWLHERGLKVTLNLHPAEGVGRHEEAFLAMCKKLDIDPSKANNIPFDCGDPAYMAAYFEYLHHPKEDQGVDFWWIDWQQGENSSIPGLRPLPWLNINHWEDQIRRRPNRRPMSFSRYGGIGAGRYPVGFSGDTVSVWESLEFQPYFTATAANVLYGYWSHDIGGHMPGEIDPELFTRWMQYGAYSPVLRTHTTKNPQAERRVWEYPEPYRSSMAKAMKDRYALIPYLYTENRKCYDTGLAAIRPLYYDYPEQKEAYRYEDEYCFGSSMIVAPVLKPAHGPDASATISFWLPEGDWYDTAHGMLLHGGMTHKRRYRVDETPVFIRSGSIIPKQVPVTRLSEGSYDNLVIDIYPGSGGQYDLYEDDGATTDYQSGKFLTIPMSWRTTKIGRTITLNPGVGNYRRLRHTRALEIRLIGCRPTKKAHSTSGDVISIAYDGETATSTIRLADYNVRKGLKLSITEDRVVVPSVDSKDSGSHFSPSTAPVAGYSGLMRRLTDVAALERLVSPIRPICDQDRLATELAQTGRRIAAHPETYVREIDWLTQTLQQLPKVLQIFQTACMKKTSGFTAKQENADRLKQARNILSAALKQFDLTQRL